MKISERNAQLVTALFAVFKEQTIVVADIANRIAGLRLEEPGHVELLEAIEATLGRTINPKRIGRRLEKIAGQRFGDLTLIRDGDAVPGRYYVRKAQRLPPVTRAELEDRANEVILDIHRERDEKIAANLGISSTDPQFDRLVYGGLDPKVKRASKGMLEAAQRRKEAADRLAEQEAAEAKLKADQQSADDRFTAHIEGLLAQGATRLTMGDIMTHAHAAMVVSKIHHPERGIEAFAMGLSTTLPPRSIDNGKCYIGVYLTGPLNLQKLRWQQLEAMLRQRGWSQNGLQGVTAELKHGKKIPASASQDPSHYNSADATVALANRLCAAGISSNDLSIEEAVLRERTFANWAALGTNLGNAMHRPGPHFDTGAAVPMRRQGSEVSTLWSGSFKDL